ncbi:MAG: hypothetical protein ACXACT_01480 [Candidatus Thorarchaeota archaeon]|jgi:hypothetical protein
MNVSKRVSVGLLSIVFIVALVSAVPVDAKKPFSVYRWYSEVTYDLAGDYDWEWSGDIWAGEKEQAEHGTIYWDNFGFFDRGPEDNGKVQKYWGKWWIIWDDGDYIEGTHEGSAPYVIFQSNIKGKITFADGDWSHLEGRNMHSLSRVLFPYIHYYLDIM